MAKVNMSLLNETGERVEALKSKKYDAFVKFMHINRYEIAKNIIEKKINRNNLVKILDLGCGFGYGSTLLSGKNRLYVGSDICADCLDYAKKVYGTKNKIWVVADCTQLPFKDNSFDFIVFFELIEHLETKNQKLALKEIARCLKNGGLLFISTPNREYLPGKIYKKIMKLRGKNIHYFSKFHKKELSFKEFKSLLKEQRNLKVIKIMGQNILPHPLGKFLISIAPNLTKYLANLLGKIFSSQATHFIAILEKNEGRKNVT